jgi:hypothetical protein
MSGPSLWGKNIGPSGSVWASWPYVLIPSGPSFYLRRWIGPRNWRRLHYGTFAAYYLGGLHVLGAGTDVRAPAALAFFATTSLIAYMPVLCRLWKPAGRVSSAGLARLAKQGQPAPET